jgi:hypothetical protein
MNLPDAPIAHEGFYATHFFHTEIALDWFNNRTQLGKR